MSSGWLVIPVGLASAFAFAVSSSLKHVSAGQVPDAQDLAPRKLVSFVRSTLAHPLWLGGIVADLVGLILQVIALHLGALAVVQPLLVAGLLFALLLRARAQRSIKLREVAWATVLTGALGSFLAIIGVGRSSASPADRGPAAAAALVGLVLAVACVRLGRAQSSRGRAAALMGVSLGAIYAATAGLLKALTDIGLQDPLLLLTSWQLYAVVLLGALSLLLTQLTFQAGPLTASLPAMSTVDPLLSIAIGVIVYDEHLHAGAGTSIVLLGLLAVLGVAILQLSRAEADQLPHRIRDDRESAAPRHNHESGLCGLVRPCKCGWPGVLTVHQRPLGKFQGMSVASLGILGAILAGCLAIAFLGWSLATIAANEYGDDLRVDLSDLRPGWSHHGPGAPPDPRW